LSDTQVRDHAVQPPLRDVLRDRRRTALLVVDVQNDFCHDDGVCARAGGYPTHLTHPAVERVKELLAAARASDLPVLHARLRVDWENEDRVWLDRLLRLRQPELCSPESFGEAAYAGAEELPGEPVYYKRRFSAFWGTSLADDLRGAGIERVIVCGVATNICVQASACDAFMDGFEVLFVSDASAAYSPEGHAAALELMDLAYGDVVSTASLVGALSESAPEAAALQPQAPSA
jgi:ureidoacrylate peracid hydrolase